MRAGSAKCNNPAIPARARGESPRGGPGEPERRGREGRGPRREALKAGLDADQAATKAAADKELELLGGVLELELPAPLPPPPPKSECGSSWHARLELCLVCF